MNARTFGKLIAAIAASQAAGIIGSVFTMGSVDGWFRTLERPALAPPDWVFGPVWTTLYTLMGIAAFLVWNKGLARPGVKLALSVFVAQLVANSLWSILFFGAQNIGAALVCVLVLWALIVLTAVLFWRISKIAALLLVPYLLWVSFATYLNYAYWVLN